MMMHGWLAVLVRIGLCVVAVTAGSPVTRLVLWRAEQPAGPIAGAALVLRGGRTIGYLKRLATYGAIMAGFPEAVALVVGIKGLGRYGELKGSTEGAAERFIIGTLTSLLFAAAAAALANWLT